MREIRLEKQAAKILEKIAKKDLLLSKKITKKIVQLAENPNLQGVKQLKGYEYKRVRVNDFRIIFLDSDIALKVYIIDKRDSVYKKLIK